MKALLVADGDEVIARVGTVLKTAGYDIITYRALLKALDNIEEIAPHLIVVSTKDYPRHWKTLAQYATVPLGAYMPQVILYTAGTLAEDEIKKAEALHIRGCFASVDVDGLDELRRILSEKDDIFSGSLNETEDGAPANAISSPAERNGTAEQQAEGESDRSLPPADTGEDGANAGETEEAADEQEDIPPAAGISIADILSQNQSFNRFADVPAIKTEEEAKGDGGQTYEFTNVRGRRSEEADSPAPAGETFAELDPATKARMQEMAENAAHITVDPDDALLLSQQEVNGILSQNQFSMKGQIDWLAKENADEPDPPAPCFDDIADPTGNEAHEIAASMGAILAQNQATDAGIGWLANENADEPSLPADAEFDDNTEPSGMSASERDANVQDIVTQNLHATGELAENREALQTLVDTMNAQQRAACSLVLTNPETGALISGRAGDFTGSQLEFTPDIPELARNFRDNMVIDGASMRLGDGIEAVTATVIATADPLILAINRHGA